MPTLRAIPLGFAWGFPTLETVGNCLGIAVWTILLVACLIESWHRWEARKETKPPLSRRIMSGLAFSLIILDVLVAIASWRVNNLLAERQEQRINALETKIEEDSASRLLGNLTTEQYDTLIPLLREFSKGEGKHLVIRVVGPEFPRVSYQYAANLAWYLEDGKMKVQQTSPSPAAFHEGLAIYAQQASERLTKFSDLLRKAQLETKTLYEDFPDPAIRAEVETVRKEQRINDAEAEVIILSAGTID